MIVQWCVKGLGLDSDEEARAVIDGQRGIVCNWWRAVGKIRPDQVRAKLIPANLDRHVNHYDDVDPSTGQPFRLLTPFISLSAGTVERDTVAKTNLVHRARRNALWFGLEFGARSVAYLYTCWLVLAPRQAVVIEGVAEEIRDLNTYRRYSPFQTEGEVTAKVHVPDNQIARCEKWTWEHSNDRFECSWVHANPRFTPPEQLSNVRALI
jgi:hypothetical protein